MKGTLLKQLNELIDVYVNQIRTDNVINSCDITPFEVNGRNELGFHALEFMKTAPQKYEHKLISPPLTSSVVENIYYLLAQIDKDLKGDLNGSLNDIQCAKEWNEFWQDILKSNPQLVNGVLTKMKHETLCAYRSHVIHSTTFEDAHAREFLLKFNPLVGKLSAHHAYDMVIDKLEVDFINDLGLDIQALSRYLSTTNIDAYLKKFEEVVSRKNVIFLGQSANTKIFSEMIKDKEFFHQLPNMLGKSEPLEQFLQSLPEAVKREQLLHNKNTFVQSDSVALLNMSPPKPPAHLR